MPSNKKRLNNAKLYLILDTQVLDYNKLLTLLKESVRFGIDVVQLRDKFGSAKDILAFSKRALKITKHEVPFILNDRLDLVQLSGADGVHVGQEDITCKDARKILGSKAIIGVSCQDAAHYNKAIKDGADYVGFGSVFKTKTKPERDPMKLDLLKMIVNNEKIPIFPIGGINSSNLETLTPLGVKRVAVCRDILLAKDPSKAIVALKKKLEFRN